MLGFEFSKLGAGLGLSMLSEKNVRNHSQELGNTQESPSIAFTKVSAFLTCEG